MSEAAPKPNKYANGKIYRIVCGDLIYIGSTCQSLANRMADHRKDHKRWKANPEKYTGTTSLRLFEIGDPEIFLLEDCPCERKEQLLARERHYVETTDCVNKNVPGRTVAEYRQANSDKIHEYEYANADKIRERKREYKIANADKIREQKREYYLANAEKICERTHEYKQANADKVRERTREYNARHRSASA